jgi:putative effector of murein hydrolase LrgA (UPF0299 family)
MPKEIKQPRKIILTHNERATMRLLCEMAGLYLPGLVGVVQEGHTYTEEMVVRMLGHVKEVKQKLTPRS